VKLKKIWMSAAVLAPVIGTAQFITGPGGQTDKVKTWDGFTLNPKTKIKIDFRNSNVDNVIAFYQKYTGITIVKDPTLTGGMTITSAKEVSLGDALNILQTKLDLMGFDLQKKDNLLTIKSRKGGDRGGISFPTGVFPTGGDQPTFTTPVAKVYPIIYANASQLARVVNDVFTASPNTQNPLARFFQGGGGAGGRGGFGGQGGGGRFGQPGGAGGFQFPGAFNFNQAQPPNVHASSDDYTNSMVVYAPPDDQKQVSDLIRALDHVADDLQTTKVFKLTYASSDDMVNLVQNVLTNNVPRGKGGATTQQTQGPGAFINALRGATPGSGQVVSDPHTNSLLVTATPENIKLAGSVIHDLDTEVKITSSTFVFPLKNARADQVQLLLQGAFGTRTGTNATTTQNRTITPTRPSTQSTTGTSSNSGRTGLPGGQNIGGGSGLQADNLPFDLADPNATSGELQTNIAVAQGFGGGLFGGGGQRGGTGGGGGGARPGGSTSGAGTGVGYGPDGKVINVRDLTNQVTSIADPNTNSIVVVTSPENAALIRDILDKLDRIPEQVMIETVITEATLDKSDALGVEFKWGQSNPFGLKATTTSTGSNFGLASGNQTTPLTGGIFTLASGNLTAFLNALQTDTKFQVLSTPRIFTSNNVQADINISQSVPYITSTTPNPLGGQPTVTYGFLDVGIVLTVNPHISSNGYVTMDVTQTANDLQGFTTFNAPIVNQRVADTSVSVKDGETIIIGGLIRSTVTATTNKVPILGDIPILGNIFKSTSHDKQKTELLLFLTPHIVRDPAEARKLKEDQLKELSPDTQKDIQKITPPPGADTSSKGGVTPVKTGGN